MKECVVNVEWHAQVKFIPEKDLRVMDALWRASSNNKFGYSVQKELWIQNRQYWERLFKVIDWTHGEHNFYRCRFRPLATCPLFSHSVATCALDVVIFCR